MCASDLSIKLACGFLFETPGRGLVTIYILRLNQGGPDSILCSKEIIAHEECLGPPTNGEDAPPEHCNGGNQAQLIHSSHGCIVRTRYRTGNMARR